MKKISVEPNPSGAAAGKHWKAIVTLPRWATKFPHPVQGQMNGSPPLPYVEGFGWTPEAAIVNAYETLGRAAFNLPEDDVEEKKTATAEA